MDRKQFLKFGLTSSLCAMLPLPAFSQKKWPAKPVTVVVPFAAGGTTDLVARLVMQAMTEAAGENFIVDNRGGAGGAIGADAVAKGPKDGYMLGIGTVSTHAIAPAVMRNLTYKAATDFAPVALLATTPIAVFVHPSVQARSMAELAQLARARPGFYNYGSPGPGTLGHLAGIWFNRSAGVDINHVPYRGSAPAMQDLLAGRIHVMFENIPTPLPFTQSGALRGIGVAAGSRVSALPGVPTTAESGFPEFQITTWTMLLAPAGTPSDIIALNNEAANVALRKENVRARLAELNIDAQGGTPKHAARFLSDEISKWDNLVKAAKLSLG